MCTLPLLAFGFLCFSWGIIILFNYSHIEIDIDIFGHLVV